MQEIINLMSKLYLNLHMALIECTNQLELIIWRFPLFPKGLCRGILIRVVFTLSDSHFQLVQHRISA